MNNKFSLYNAHPLRIVTMLIFYFLSFAVLFFMGPNKFNLAIMICSFMMLILSTILAYLLLYMQVIFEDNEIIIKSFRRTIVIKKEQIKYIEFLKSDSVYSRVAELSPCHQDYKK